jgi:hypothetical protein
MILIAMITNLLLIVLVLMIFYDFSLHLVELILGREKENLVRMPFGEFHSLPHLKQGSTIILSPIEVMKVYSFCLK